MSSTHLNESGQFVVHSTNGTILSPTQQHQPQNQYQDYQYHTNQSHQQQQQQSNYPSAATTSQQFPSQQFQSHSQTSGNFHPSTQSTPYQPQFQSANMNSFPPKHPQQPQPYQQQQPTGYQNPSQQQPLPLQSHQPYAPPTTYTTQQQQPHSTTPYQPSFNQLSQQFQPSVTHNYHPPQNTPQPTHTLSHAPVPSSVVFIGDRCARLWGMLWHSDFKLRINIPDSILFCNGAFHSYLFSSARHRGEIRKKKGQLSLDEIRECLVERAEKDASNVTPYVAILQAHDSSLMPVPYTSLPRILRSIGSLPREDRIAQASFAGVPKRNDEVDLYQVVRAYVHPLHGLRFLTTYKFQGEALDFSTMTSHVQPTAPGSKPRHTISTVCGRFSDRYQVLPEERAFYDEDNAGRETVLPPVPDVVARECERMTLCVVEWLSRIHGIGCKTLTLEFIQSYSKKLLLHSVVEVVFQPEPTLDATPSLGLQLLASVNDQGEEKENFSSTTPPLPDTTFHQSYSGGGSATAVPPSSATFGEDYTSLPSSSVQSRAPSRPASASVRPSSASAGRTGRTKSLATSASSAAFRSAAAPPAHALTARPSTRPTTATASGAATARASDELEEQLRNVQPPRGFVGSVSNVSNSTAVLPRTSRAKMMKNASNNALKFSTLIQFETRTEMDDRLSRGGLRPNENGAVMATDDPSASPTSMSGQGGRADFLLFHWRQQARTAQEEIVRLNEELETSSKKWKAKEEQLMSLLHMEERKVLLLSTQNQTSQMENEALKQELDGLRLASNQKQLELETTINNLKKEIEVNQLIISRLEELKKRNSDELLSIQGEKTNTEGELNRLKNEKLELSKKQQRAEHELGVAQKVRDELLEKLESEENFARSLAQQLDLMSDWNQFEDMRHLFAKASGLARNEGARLKEVEALRSQVVKYTKDRTWQDRKLQLQKQAKALKKSALASGDARAIAGAQMDPVPERRAADIIYERALNRMTH